MKYKSCDNVSACKYTCYARFILDIFNQIDLVPGDVADGKCELSECPNLQQ
jgi:hypothetical protein